MFCGCTSLPPPPHKIPPQLVSPLILCFQAEYCSKNGVDSLLTLPELYFKPASVPELVDFVELVAKAAPNLPVLYYHIPSMSKVESTYFPFKNIINNGCIIFGPTPKQASKYISCTVLTHINSFCYI